MYSGGRGGSRRSKKRHQRDGGGARSGGGGGKRCGGPKQPNGNVRGSGNKNWPSNQQLPRDQERRFFDKLTKHGDAEIRDQQESKRFFKAALAYASEEGGTALLYRLVEDAGGLRKSLEYITEPAVFTDGFVPLVERLGQEDLNKPVFQGPMKTLLSNLYAMPFLTPCIERHISAGRLTQNDEKTAVAWMYSKIALEDARARGDKDIIEIAKALASSGCVQRLQTILSGENNPSAPNDISLTGIRQDQSAKPGGRHDNDRSDFRSIRIVPTCREFMCDAEPYLPKASTAESPGEVTEAWTLDRQFRLLREDIIGPSKEQQDDPRKENRDIFYAARPIRVHSGAAVFREKNGKKIKVSGETDPCIIFRIKIPDWRLSKANANKDYWEKNRRILPRDALVCLQRKNEKNVWTPFRFAVIVRRESNELSGNPSTIGLGFDSKDDINETIRDISDSSLQSTRLVVVSSELFAYEPILRGLQMMDGVPFNREIVQAMSTLPDGISPIQIPQSLQGKVNQLDGGQRRALEASLAEPVSLIQGPPGTGKTFIGVLLTQIFLQSTDETILVVTYTNHALDDFLENLLDLGITEIVRMGGRSQNERIAEYNLRELANSGKAPFTRDQTRRFAHLKGEIEVAEKELYRLERQVSREIGAGWWDRVGPFLEENHRESWMQLRLSSSDIVDEDGFRVQGISGEDCLWKCWLKGKKPPVPLSNRADGSLWKLSKQERHKQKLVWQHELYSNMRSEMAILFQTIKTARGELKQLQQVTDAEILSKARVIACTTTKAAMCKALLEGVGSGIVLVEEAAEIFEAHVLTSLSSRTKRLVMIGDHNQLRPKCQHYPLTVESGRGFDLNCSLFERLAKSKEISTLGVQHRMHPDISAVPKLVTYHDLKDAPSVVKHPHPLGLQSRVIFINHNHLEDSESNEQDDLTVSKTNLFEREMVVAIVRYLFQQGYAPQDLVVLTPYLGQMMRLQSDLSKDFDVLIDDRDLSDARNLLNSEDFPIVGGTLPKPSAVRVATIDNYQGEESKIVIISLVRSNPNGQIGFLKEPERVNVMLSRARDCEIIIGNRQTLEASRGCTNPLKGGALWKKIFGLWESQGFTFDGLPSKCQTHGTASMLCCAQDFKIHCQEGGCTKTCEKKLECGHLCKMKCHAGKCRRCSVICLDVCSRGHTLRKFCGDDNIPKCKRIIYVECVMGHKMSRQCCNAIDFSSCGICINLKREEDKLDKREEELAKKLAQKQQELEKVKRRLALAKQEKRHQEELATIEAELTIAEKELQEPLESEGQAKTKKQPLRQPLSAEEKEDSVPNCVSLDNNMRTLLTKAAPKSISLSHLPAEYKKQFGCDMQSHTKQKRKVKDMLKQMPFCEIFKRQRGEKTPSNFEFHVRLVEAEHADREKTKCRPRERSDFPSEKKVRSLDQEVEVFGTEDVTFESDPISEKNKSDDTEEQPAVDETEVQTKDSMALKESSSGATEASSQDITQSYAEKNRAEFLSDHVSASSAVVEGENVCLNNKDFLGKTTCISDKKEEVPETGVDATISRVLKRYIEDGPLAADDLLEKLPKLKGLNALQFIIQNELDPKGGANAPSLASGQSALVMFVACAAKAIEYRKKYPLQAREFSIKALSFKKLCSKFHDSVLPQSWISEIQEISEAVSDSSKPTRTSTQNLKNNEDGISNLWKEIEMKDADCPPVMRDSVLPMIGLESVKRRFVEMYHRVRISQEQGDGKASSYNIRFEGNPGTGKTTIARHYGLFLQQLKVLPSGSLFQETNGSKLVFGGVKGLKDLLEEIQKAKGGVIFVDEAYQLATEREGKKVLDFILPLAESLSTEYGDLVWIFAGYKKPMEKLFEYNEGLYSRFPLHFVFEDYSDAQLLKIFKSMMEFQMTKPQKTEGAKDSRAKNTAHQSPLSYRFSGYSYPQANRRPITCRFGLQWKYVEYSGWTDKYGNRTVDPHKVGTPSSELIDPAGKQWVEQGGIWKSDDGSSQTHIPGSPAPIKTEARERRRNPYHCDETDLLMSIKRLGRQRGENGFGNARSVRVLFERVKDRQAARIVKARSRGDNPDLFFFARTDLLGPDVTEASLKSSKAWAELEAMEGIKPVKESIQQLFSLVLRNSEREKRGEDPLFVSLNRIFLGNPGTGKTSVARLYGRILCDLGLLSKGEVILKNATDFVSDHLGGSEKLTQGILKSAEGSVLVIDEAYSLYSGGSSVGGTNDPYKTAVIDTIVEKVQAKPGADIAVVMIGYQEEMERMMQNVNPGLSRRFQLENAFHFPDFDDAALVRIMMAKARERGVRLELSVAKRAVRTLAKSRAKPNFGNAGAVDNLLSKGITRMQSRISEPYDSSVELCPGDFEYGEDGPDSDVLDTLFDDLIGCDAVKEKMDELRATVEFSIAQGKDPKSAASFNYLFLGNPGTGKTTVARRMGKMFCALGLLPGDELKEAKANDLITGYTGQAGLRTRAVLRESLGGVLFIDEAYQLDPSRGGSYMSEAVDELVGALTEKEFKGKLMVILAGYDADMEKMLKTNPGLKSRFSERVKFPDFDAHAVVRLLDIELKKHNVPLKELNEIRLKELAQRIIRESGHDFGNGRDVVTWADRVYRVVAGNYSKKRRSIDHDTHDAYATIEDVQVALESILSARKVNVGQSCVTNPYSGALSEANEMMSKPPPVQTVIQQSVETDKRDDMQDASDTGERAEDYEGSPPPNLFESIDDRVLGTLQDFIDENGLGSQSGSNHLAQLDPESQEFADLIAKLESSGLSYDTAKAQLLKWQELQEDLEKMIEQERQKKITLGARPIWRCGVCGRADKPWIACYVAPYIVRYEKIPVGEE